MLPLEHTSTTFENASAMPIVNKRTQNLALSAVILEEWLKELAAMSQEQSIVMLTETILNQY